MRQHLIGTHTEQVDFWCVTGTPEVTVDNRRLHSQPVGARKRLAVWLGRDGPLDYEGVKRAVRRWWPFAGLLYFHLLLAGLAESGELPLDHAAQLCA